MDLRFDADPVNLSSLAENLVLLRFIELRSRAVLADETCVRALDPTLSARAIADGFGS